MRLGRLSIEDNERRLRLDLEGRRGVSAEYPDTWARHDVTRVKLENYKRNTTTITLFESKRRKASR
jgi:hypothetical protein